MNTIAINVILNDSYWESRYCVENLIAKTSLSPKIYLTLNGCKDNRLAELYMDLCSKYKGIVFQLPESKNISNATNLFLQNCKEDYICLFPVHALVNEAWLENLLSAHRLYKDSGIIGIRNGIEKTLMTSILQENDLFNEVWTTEHNTVEGIMFASKEVFDKVGLFEESENITGFEQIDYCFRASSNGYNNFYVLKNTCAKIEIENEILFPKKTKESWQVYKNKVEEIVKQQRELTE